MYLVYKTESLAQISNVTVRYTSYTSTEVSISNNGYSHNVPSVEHGSDLGPPEMLKHDAFSLT